MLNVEPNVERAGAIARIRRALRHIEAAQNELLRASQELSTLIGWVSEYDALGRSYERVKTLWYRVERKWLAGKHLRLDEMGLERLRREGDVGTTDDRLIQATAKVMRQVDTPRKGNT